MVTVTVSTFLFGVVAEIGPCWWTCESTDGAVPTTTTLFVFLLHIAVSYFGRCQTNLGSCRRGKYSSYQPRIESGGRLECGADARSAPFLGLCRCFQRCYTAMRARSRLLGSPRMAPICGHVYDFHTLSVKAWRVTLPLAEHIDPNLKGPLSNTEVDK
jgi:hypothetical protein